MEKQMLAALEYDLTVPTCFLFTARFRKAAGVQDDIKVGPGLEGAGWRAELWCASGACSP
jgi:hypothetical protein